MSILIAFFGLCAGLLVLSLPICLVDFLWGTCRTMSTTTTRRTVRKEYRIWEGSKAYEFVIDAFPTKNGTYELYARLHPPDPHGRGGMHHHLMSG